MEGEGLDLAREVVEEVVGLTRAEVAGLLPATGEFEVSGERGRAALHLLLTEAGRRALTQGQLGALLADMGVEEGAVGEVCR